jgi:pimeloyl-ACP methyl ester carboxylesterase
MSTPTRQAVTRRGFLAVMAATSAAAGAFALSAHGASAAQWAEPLPVAPDSDEPDGSPEPPDPEDEQLIAQAAHETGENVMLGRVTSARAQDATIRPFVVDVPDAALDDLRRRITATRLPSKELVADRSQGVQVATIRELARYWATDYDWRKAEAKLNALPQFTTQIDGVDIHFIHVKSPHQNALPLIMTHGWPGSVVELLDAVGPLTDPTAHGGRTEDAFDLVLPSLPGYGFSGEPKEVGWNPGRIARAWAELMRRLGYPRYVAQGGDLGAIVADAMGRQAPEGLLGIHLNLLSSSVASGPMPAESEKELAALDALNTFKASGFGYFLEQATRPQTIGYALLDSPVSLAAWMLDHDTDSYYKISRAFVDGQPSGNLTRDHILDNVTLYWLTGTGASAARAYWENGRAAALAGGQAPPAVSVPVGFTTFPGEIYAAPRSWVEIAYPTLSYFNEVDRGGHFAAWEQPELFSDEVRAAFRSLR